jgi:hypothetical protein
MKNWAYSVCELFIIRARKKKKDPKVTREITHLLGPEISNTQECEGVIDKRSLLWKII